MYNSCKFYLDEVFSLRASLLIDELNDSDNIFVSFDCKEDNTYLIKNYILGRAVCFNSAIIQCYFDHIFY